MASQTKRTINMIEEIKEEKLVRDGQVAMKGD